MVESLYWAAKLDKETSVAQWLSTQQLQLRYTKRVERYLKESSLPRTKSLANFDFTSCPTIDKAQIERLATDTAWLKMGENLLLFGPSGVGKTPV